MFLPFLHSSHVHPSGCAPTLRSIDDASFIQADSSARHRVFFFDSARTVLEPLPHHADPSPKPRLIHLLLELSKIPNTLVVINSARPKHLIDAWFGRYAPIGLAAENGYWLRAPQKEWKISQPEADLEFYEPSRDFLREMKNYIHGSILIEKTAGLSFVHRDLDPRLSLRLGEDFEGILVKHRGLRLRAIHNKTAVEFLPIGIDKGSLVQQVLDPSHFLSETIVIGAGDDTADEDMFLAINNHHEANFSIRVGDEPLHHLTPTSRARYGVRSVAEFLDILERLVQAFK